MRQDDDHEITFYLQVFYDYGRAQWALSQLRRHYPTSRVIVASDGDPNIRYTQWLNEFEIELLYGRNLYRLTEGGGMLKRVLNLWGCDSNYLVTIDTDTCVHRRFRSLPDAQAVVMFGDCQPIQGGCKGFTKNAGRKILHSGILDDPILSDPVKSFAMQADGKLNRVVADTAIQQQRIVEDWMWSWVCRQLEIPCLQHPEIYSRWRQRVPEGLDVAISHPHKEIPLDRTEL